MSKLTAKQKAFAAEYAVDFNGTQAAIRAGYSKRTARQMAAENLTKAEVAEAVREAVDAALKATGLTAERVLQELQQIGFADPGDYSDWGPDGVKLKPKDSLTKEQRSVISSVKEVVTQHGGSIEFKTNDKLKALELLGRYLKMFTDRIEQTNEVEIIFKSNSPGPPACQLESAASET